MKKLLLSLLVLIVLVAVCSFAMADTVSRETITIINVDRVNVRTEDGTSIGRIGVYTPVQTYETKNDMTYITFSKEFYEIIQEEYTLGEYGNLYNGTGSGWIKTTNLSQAAMTEAEARYLAEECRFEAWVNGIYHQLNSSGNVTKTANRQGHNPPKVNNRELTAHTTYLDLIGATPNPTAVPYVTPLPWNNWPAAYVTATPSPSPYYNYNYNYSGTTDLYWDVQPTTAPDQLGQWRIEPYQNGYFIQYEEIYQGIKYSVSGYFVTIPRSLDLLRWWRY